MPKYVVIPSFRLNGSDSDSWRPIFLNNFPESNNKHVTVIDADLYSSAAPIYFPSYKSHVDGGLIANNPSTAAIAMAADPYYANQIGDDICLLSIGTGFCPIRLQLIQVNGAYSNGCLTQTHLSPWKLSCLMGQWKRIPILVINF